MKIICEICGDELEICKTDSDFDFYVSPCDGCLANAYDEGYQEGKNDTKG